MEEKKRKQLHVIKFDKPKDILEMAKQMKMTVDYYYDTMCPQGDTGAPAAFFIKFLLDGDGPLHMYAHLLCNEWKKPMVEVAETMISAIGIAARCKEVELLAKAFPDYPNGQPTIEWAREHKREMSFSLLCGMQDALGLGCCCAFCYATYIACHWTGEGEGNLKELWTKLKAFSDASGEDNEENCVATLLDQVADEEGWPQPEGHWEMKMEKGGYHGRG